MKKYQLAAIVSLVICVQVQATTLAISIKDGDGKALADAVVYMQSANQVSTPTDKQLQIEQVNKEFHPFVSVVPVGTSAFFPNRDGIGHHVYSFSGAKTFQLPLSEQETTVSVLFDTPGVVTIGCNIHDWMVAYINVVNTLYYAVTGADGNITISDVPPGSYTLHVWHPGIKTPTDMEQQLTIEGNDTRNLGFTIDIKPEYFWKPTRPAAGEEAQY